MTKKQENAKWDEVLMNIQAGDILISKKGFLSKTPITDEWVVYTRVKYLGDGSFIILSNKRTVDIKTKGELIK